MAEMMVGCTTQEKKGKEKEEDDEMEKDKGRWNT